MAGTFAPRGEGKGHVASKPIATKNRWNIIAPDDDEEYEPNNAVTGPITKDASNYFLPTSNIPIKRGRKGNSTHSTSASTPYSPILGCMLACTKVEPQDHAAKTQDTLADMTEDAEAAAENAEVAESYNSAISTCEKAKGGLTTPALRA